MATSILSSFLPYENFWRIPFFIGATISFLGYKLRKKIKENLFITNIIYKNYIPFRDFFKIHYKNFLCATLVSGFAGAMFYTSFIYPHLYLVALKGWSFRYSLMLCSIGMLLYAAVSPFAGSLIYKKGIKKMMLIWSILTIIFILPIFYFLNINYLTAIISATIMLSILSSFFQVCVNIFLVHSFPVEVRYRGVALSYCLGLAIFGGTTVPILMYFKEKQLDLLMGGHIIFISILAILAISFSELKFKIHADKSSTVSPQTKKVFINSI